MSTSELEKAAESTATIAALKQRNYWLHRISHFAGLSYPLLEDKGFLTIGFADFTHLGNTFIHQVLLGKSTAWIFQKCY